jgi:O-antigen/teichoic acid export membrane protein
MLTIVLGRGLQFLLALVIMKMGTTLLSPEEMGKVSLTLSTIAFFALFLINPVGMFINRRLHSWYVTGVAKHYLIRYLIYLVAIAIVAAISLLIINHFAVVNFGMNICWLVFLVCASLIFNTINQTSIPSLNLLGNVKPFIFLTVATLLASFLFAITIVNHYDFTASYWLFGIVLGQITFAIIGTKILFKQLDQLKTTLRFQITKAQIKTLFAFCWPVAIAAGLGWIQAQGYRYIFESQLGFSELGLFVAGYSVSAGVIAGFESILTTYFQPRFYQDVQFGDNNSKVESWLSYSRAVIPSLVVTIVFVALLAPEFTRLFLGANFHSAEKYVVWGAIVEASRVLISVYTLNAHGQMRTRLVVVPYLIGAVVSVFLTVFLIPILGATGVGLALVCSGFLTVFAMNYFLAIKIGRLIESRRMLHILVVFIAALILSVGIRYFFNQITWTEMIAMFISVGTIYLIALYFFLNPFLFDNQ